MTTTDGHDDDHDGDGDNENDDDVVTSERRPATDDHDDER